MDSNAEVKEKTPTLGNTVSGSRAAAFIAQFNNMKQSSLTFGDKELNTGPTHIA